METTVDPRIFVYGLSTASFYAWELIGSKTYTGMPVFVLLAWIFVMVRGNNFHALHVAPFLLLHAGHVAMRSPCTFEAEVWGMQTDTVMAL
jgi:hypothetical protein